MVNLTTLAPDIQVAIRDEALPDTVSLFDLASDTPLSWERAEGTGLRSYRLAHSITRSARSRTDCGTWTPIVRAAFMLTINSYRDGCSMARSAGFAPARIFAT